MKNDAIDTAEVGGGSPPSALPVNVHPIKYENKWDPALVAASTMNIMLASRLGLPELELSPKLRGGKCIVVGSGPSVMEHIEDIRALSKDKLNMIFTVNEAHGLLLKNGISPNGALVFEIAPRAYKFLDSPAPDCTYYICSICDPGAFKALENNKRVVWHCATDIWLHRKALMDGFGKFNEQGAVVAEPMLVGGGFTTFLRTLNIAYVLGFRDYDLFGFESSFEGDSSHFFGTPDYGGEIMDAYVKVGPGDALTKFKSKAYLIRQADEFRQHIETWHKDFKMRVHGRGLLPSLHHHLQPQMYGE